MESKSVVENQKVIVRNHRLAAELKRNKDAANSLSERISTMLFALMEYVRSAYQFTLPEFSLLIFPDERHGFYKSKRAVLSSTSRDTGFRLESFLAFSSLFGFSLRSYIDTIGTHKNFPDGYNFPNDAKLTKLFADSSVRAKYQMALALSKDERLPATLRAYASELVSQSYLGTSFDPRQLKELIWNRQKDAQEFASLGNEYFDLATYLAAYYGLPRIIISELTLGESAAVSAKYRTYSPVVINGKTVQRMPTIKEFTNLCLLFGYDIPTTKTHKLLSLDSLVLPYLVLTGLNPKSAADMVRVALDYETNATQRRVDFNTLSWLESL